AGPRDRAGQRRIAIVEREEVDPDEARQVNGDEPAKIERREPAAEAGTHDDRSQQERRQPAEHELGGGRPPARRIARSTKADRGGEPDQPDPDVAASLGARRGRCRDGRAHERTAGSTFSPKSRTVESGSTARLTENMSRLTPAARAARTCASHSSGVPQIARRQLR